MANTDRHDKRGEPDIPGRKAVLLWLAASLAGWLAVLLLLMILL